VPYGLPECTQCERPRKHIFNESATMLLDCSPIRERKKGMRTRLILSGVAAVLMLASSAHAQVTVDIAKITCKQYLTFAVADPRDIAIWLSGYLHGQKSSTVLQPEDLKKNADKLKSACFQIDNADLPVMQVAEKMLSEKK
jgi:hypothetical protein